jgi:murein L,D-transpeptidase YcbB/YkuD
MRRALTMPELRRTKATRDQFLMRRAFSHGCMRVQDPDQYAEVLLRISQPEDGYSVQLIRSLYGTGERTINLKNPIPVYITYQTAFVDDAAQLHMRPDIYGLDQVITNLLKGDSDVADIPISRNYTVANKPVIAHDEGVR